MTRRTIELREHETRDVMLDPDDVAAIRSHPERPAELEVSVVPGQLTLRAQAKVGAVRFPGFDLIVRPKAGLRNVFYLMGVENPPAWWGNREVDLLMSQDLFAGIARLLSHSVERAIGPGIRHDYVERCERLVALRGRIDMADQLRRNLPVPMSCRYDDYTADTKLNQLLLAALTRVRRLPALPAILQRTLRLQVAQMDAVSAVPPDLVWADEWQPNRLDRRYLPAVRLSTLVLRHLMVSEAPGQSTSHSFLIDMNVLFERFLTERLRLRLAELDPSVEVASQEPDHLDVEGRLPIRTDILVRSKGRVISVLDAKYVLLGQGDSYVSHHYQLLAYATRYRTSDAILIYATNPDKVAPAGDVLSKIRNSDVRIHSMNLDLTGDPVTIEAGIKSFASRVLELSGSPLTSPASTE